MAEQKIPHHKIAIIGSGFSGLGMAIKLKQKDEQDFVVFEKEGGVGGTWRVNHYPGCACDVPSHLYSFSFVTNPRWSRMFAPQKEIENYLEHCADRFNLYPHIQLNTEIASAKWVEEKKHWKLKTSQGKSSTSDFLVVGAGGLSTPAYPTIPGVEKFKGKRFHSQQWDHDYDLTGKRVAVVGTGASAIQFVPEIQKSVKQLDLYQRTAPWIMSKPDRAISSTEKFLFKKVPATQRIARELIYWLLESRVIGFAINPKLMKLAKNMALKHIHSQVSDPELRDKVTPDYTIGCKRILMSDTYYPALTQPNVDVINLGIKEVTKTGVVDSEGNHRDVDAIIYGTGFQATNPIPSGLVFGKEGQDIVDGWKDGPEAYKGTTVSGFPNMFILMGPNTGLGHNSMVYMIESQITYVLDALSFMESSKIPVIDVDEGHQRRYNEKIQNKLTGSVWNNGGCQSWYIHPVSGKNVTLWPGFTWQYRKITKHFDAYAYDYDPLIGRRASQTTINTANSELVGVS